MANEKFKINGVVSEVVPIVGTTGDILKKTASGVEWGELAKATQTQDGLLSKEDFNKLAGIETGAQKNNVTSTDIANWNNKVDKVTGKGLSKNDYTDVEKTKLAGIESGANKTEIINDLTSGGINKALSAEQGKVLFQNVDNGKDLVANAIIDKGGSGVSNDSTFQELANGVINIKSGGEVDANLVNSSGAFGFNGDLTIPSEIDGISVTSIGDYAFNYCSGLTNVTIPNSVTSIGASAFNYCSGLTNVTIPNSVTSIGSYAFQRCSGLTNVTIPNSVTSIGDSAFNSCSGLTNVTIPNSVTSIGARAFANCSNLATAYVPEGLTYPSNAFPTTTNIIRYTPGGADDPTI